MKYDSPPLGQIIINIIKRSNLLNGMGYGVCNDVYCEL